MKQAASCAMDFLRSEDGPTNVEYAVMMALIIVVVMTAVTLLALVSSTMYLAISWIETAVIRRR